MVSAQQTTFLSENASQNDAIYVQKSMYLILDYLAMLKFLRLCNHRTVCMGNIPIKRDMRHVISRWEGPSLSEAKGCGESKA